MEIKNINPLVSVIVPVYNGADFVSETINSILNQTYTNLEIILIDDCSTDNSRQVIDSFTDSRIKRIYLERNGNVCVSGNKGVECSTGEYIATIGHDDVWLPEKIEKQVEYMNSHPDISVCFTRANIINENGEATNDMLSEELAGLFRSPNLSKEKNLYRLLTVGNCFCAPSALISRKVIEKTGFYRLGMVQLQDYDLWVRILLLTEGNLYTMEEVLTNYRRFSDNTTNLSSKSLESMARDRHEAHYLVYDAIKKMDSDLFIRVFKDYIINPECNSEAGIKCEKSLILAKLQNSYFPGYIISLFEEKDCRDYFAEKCNFYPKDFYALNSAPIKADEIYYEFFIKQGELIKQMT